MGRLLKDKGVAELMEAHVALRARGMVVELALCGDVDAGNPKSFTRTEAETFGNAEGCKWLGRRDDVLEQIAASHLLVLPTYREGLPRVLLEAGLARRAVVATDVPGCREVVENRISGLLCDSKDYLDLADKMEVMINLSFQERKMMGIKGREKIEKEFNHKIVNDLYIDAIEN